MKNLLITLPLLVLLTSCNTLPKEPKIELPTIQLQATFPDPIDENGNAIVTLDGDTVKMPLWYWLKITDYVIDVEANRKLRETKQ